MPSQLQTIDWLAIAPPLTTAVTALLVLVLGVSLRRPGALPGWLSVAGLAVALLTLLPLTDGDRSTFCLARHRAACSYTADHFALSMQLLVLGGALLAALLSQRSVRTPHPPGGTTPAAEHAKPGRHVEPGGEFWFLLLASTTGAALLPASRDLATLVVALEVTALPGFALVGIGRGARSAEAAWKFFLTSVTATAVTLLGVSFVYAASGALYLNQVATGLERAPGQLATLAGLGAVLTLVGFAFKVAAVPFHFWVPDTYVGAPPPVAAYLAVVGKAAGLSGIAVLTVRALPAYAHLWGPTLAVLAALTMTVGNLAALRGFTSRHGTAGPNDRSSAVRMLAWSSIAQAGFLLAPLAAAGSTAHPAHAVAATIAFALIYAVLTFGAFGVVTLVGRDTPGLRLADHRALYSRRPLAALLLGFCLLGLAGMPPSVVGLFGKVVVFRAVLDAGLGWLAVLMAFNVVLGLYYYLLWTTSLFAKPSVPAPTPKPRGARPPAGLWLGLVATAVLGVLLSVLPQLVLRFAQQTLFG